MIARVRIAPMENWCDAHLSAKAGHLAGQPIDIVTESARKSRTAPACDGKEWLVEPQSKIRLGSMVGYDYSSVEVWVCEHMLEMD